MQKRFSVNGPYARTPAQPHDLTDRTTPTNKAIVLCHLGIPDIEAANWSLTIDGLVDRPTTLNFSQLNEMPFHELESVHQCAGNPLAPEDPTRRVCNVIWGGVLLRDIFNALGVMPAAKFVWAVGFDEGVLAGTFCPSYTKDLPIERVNKDVLVALKMNGESLLPEHGFPARLVVPGYYGTNSVKWLNRLELRESRAPGLFTTKWYNDPVFDESGLPTGRSKPVWSVAPQSIIVSPGPNANIQVGCRTEVWGWAWADGGVDQVELIINGSACFKTEVEKPAGYAWQRFRGSWVPTGSGKVTLSSRARAISGELQPESGRRNAAYSVEVEAV